jgi:hypothetical protein
MDAPPSPGAGGDIRLRYAANGTNSQFRRSRRSSSDRGDLRGKVFPIVSRKAAILKVVNLEEGLPTVERARLRLEHELNQARRSGYVALKLIHGYGSSGVGGALRTELQKELRQAVDHGSIRAFIAGENWRISDEASWALLQRFPEWKQDSDLGRGNRGISIVVL